MQKILHRFIDEVEVKRCGKCGQWKTLSHFSRAKEKLDCLRSRCSGCRKKETSQAYLKNRKELLEKRRERRFKRRYNITTEQYNTILKKQGSVCAICGTKECSTGKRLAVDHNHKTGQVRGLLCGKCNRGLGLFQDSPTLLQKTIDYLAQAKVE